MAYHRKIKYLDYYERGERVKGSGFAKLEVREGMLRLELSVRGLHMTDTFVRDVVLQADKGEMILGQIDIQNGSGLFCYSGQADRGIGSTEIRYEELKGLKIPIGGTREILCAWDGVPVQAVLRSDGIGAVSAVKTIPAVTDREEGDAREPELLESAQENARETRVSKEPAPAGSKQEEKDPQEPVPAESEREEGDPQEPAPAESEREKAVQRKFEHAENRPGETGFAKTFLRENTEVKTAEVMGTSERDDKIGPVGAGAGSQEKETAGDSDREPVRLLEDKWQQLSQIYPHIQPFQDERDYLSLTPTDFVLFPAKYYRAVNNSFLLHGYYNYHHLILARMERRGEIVYYIGVPGNYFDRERQVAIMFGFESFECGAEPAKTGDFGYYMMRTEL